MDARENPRTCVAAVGFDASLSFTVDVVLPSTVEGPGSTGTGEPGAVTLLVPRTPAYGQSSSGSSGVTSTK